MHLFRFVGRVVLLLMAGFLSACSTNDPSNLLAFLLSNRSPLFLSTTSPAGPGNQGKQIEDQLLLVISQSTSSLYCSFEDVNIPTVLEALHVAHLRGVEVKVGLEDDNKGYIGYRVLAGYMTTTGLNRQLWTGNAGTGGVYLNMCVSDRIFAWLSTSPPTMQGIYSETAFAAIIRTEEEGMARKFSMEADVVTHGTFGSARQRLNQRNYWLVTGLNLGLYFSPEEDPVEGFLLSRLRSASSSITGYSSEFLSNELDSSKVRESKDLAFEIKNSPLGFKQMIGSSAAENLLDTDEISKTNSLKYLRNNGISVPVVAGGWPDNGLNFFILGRGGPSAVAFVSSHPYSTKADSAHDGFLMAFDNPTIVGQLTALYEELLLRSYMGGASSTAEDPTSPNGLEVVISEINWMGGYKANATTTTTYEYAELYNNGTSARNLSGWRFSCGSNGSFTTVYTLPSGTLIGPKDFLLITGSSTSNTLLAQAHVKVSAGSNLISDTTTEQCRLTASNGTVVDTAGAQGVRFSSNIEVFGYNDTSNKIRRSMERTDTTTSGNNTTNWHTNTTAGFMTNYNIGKDFIDRTFGTPGLPNTAAGTRTFNVILAQATTDSTHVTVSFSEVPDGAASTASNYTIGVGSCASTLAVSAASVSGNDVTLTTAAQVAGTLYTVCVSNVKAASSGTSLTTSTATFYAFVAQCVSPNVLITEFHGAPNASTQDSNADGLAESTQDEFVEIKNVSGAACGLVGYVIADGSSVRHTFGAGAALAAGQRYVIYGGGTPPFLGTAVTDVANSGTGLSLNNTSADAVKLCSTATGCAGSTTCSLAAPEIDCVQYSGSGVVLTATLPYPASGVSYARTGEAAGNTFNLHTPALNANEPFSPGYAPGSMPPFVYQFAASRTSPRSAAPALAGTTIRIQFSTAMNTGNLTNTNIKLFRDTSDTCSQNEVTLGSVVNSTTTFTNDTVTFTPSPTPLDEPATYCMRVSTAVTSLNGVALLQDAVYEFYTQAPATPGVLRINEIGNAAFGTSANDFVELINTGITDIDLAAGGYYIQRDSDCNLSNGITEKVALTGTIPAGGYFVFAGTGSTLPNVNQYGLSSLSGGDCAILTQGNSSVTSATDGQVLDFVGTTGSIETESGVTAPDIGTSGTAVSRSPNGTDTNVNSADFIAIAASPGAATGSPSFTSSPTSGATGVSNKANIVFTFSEAMTPSGETVSVVGSSSGAQNSLACVWSGGNTICTINPPTDLTLGETVSVTMNGFVDASSLPPITNSLSFSVSSSLVCAAGDVLITEVHPAPASTMDANYDGTSDTTQDEFIEIKNVSGSTCSIAGFVLSDGGATSARHTFGSVSMTAGERIVVYSGNTGSLPTLPGTQVYAASSGALNLNNTGPETAKLCSSFSGCAATTCSSAAPEIDCIAWNTGGVVLTGTLPNPTSGVSFARTGDTGGFDLHTTLSASERFSPGTAAGSAAPRVYTFAAASTSPASGATGVSTSASIVVQFSEGMNAGTLINANIKIFQDTVAGGCSANEVAVGAPTVGTTTITNDRVTFTPSSALATSTTYCVRVGTGVQSANNIALPAQVTWQFTTSASASCGNANAGDVVISEISTTGGTASDEYVEIYNKTGSCIDISSWTLRQKGSTGTITTRATVPSSTSIASHGYYLFGVGTIGATADTTMTASLANTNNGAAIFNSSATIIDSVVWGTVTGEPGSWGETTNFAGFTGTSTNALERKAVTGSTAASLWTAGSDVTAGNGFDAGNNSTDFVIQTNGKNPQNSASAVEP